MSTPTIILLVVAWVAIGFVFWMLSAYGGAFDRENDGFPAGAALILCVTLSVAFISFLFFNAYAPKLNDAIIALAERIHERKRRAVSPAERDAQP